MIALVIVATQQPLADAFGARSPLWMDMLASVGEIFLAPLLYIYWTLSYLELKKTKVVTP